MNKIPRIVTPIIPGNTSVPSAARISAPAPQSRTGGTTPRMKGIAVIRIALSRHGSPPLIDANGTISDRHRLGRIAEGEEDSAEHPRRDQPVGVVEQCPAADGDVDEHEQTTPRKAVVGVEEQAPDAHVLTGGEGEQRGEGSEDGNVRPGWQDGRKAGLFVATKGGRVGVPDE